MMLSPGAKRVCLLGVGALECLLFGGWIFGWASLVFVFKQEGYFLDRCPEIIVGNESGASPTPGPAPPAAGCDDQDAMLQLVFTVANFFVSGTAFPLGLLFDRWGTLFMRILVSILMLAGSLLFALSSTTTELLIFPAAVCVSIGGVQILVVNLQISNLFGRSKWIVMTLMCGCFDSSAFVFLVVKVLSEELKVPIQTTFYTLAGCTLLLLLNTVFLLPKKGTIPWPLPSDYYETKLTLNVAPRSSADESSGTNADWADGASSKSDPSADATSLNNAPVTAPSQPTTLQDFPSLKKCVFSLIFFSLYIWFSILQLDILFFLSTLNPVLARLANYDEEIVSQYTNALAFIQLGGIICAPMSGLLLSRNKSRNRCKNKEKETERLERRGPYSDMQDAAIVYAVTTTVCVAFCVCALLQILEVQYATFVLSVVGRSFVYSLNASGMSLFFPTEYFGALYGLMIGLSAIVSLLQYPLFLITQTYLNNDDFWVKIGLISASAMTYIHPIFVYIYFRRKKRNLHNLHTHQSKNGIEVTMTELVGSDL